MASPDFQETKIQSTRVKKNDTYISDVDKELKISPRVSLLIGIEQNRARRNIALFFTFTSSGLIYWQDWNKWIYLLPIILALLTVLAHCNIVLLMHELKRRAAENQKH